MSRRRTQAVMLCELLLGGALTCCGVWLQVEAIHPGYGFLSESPEFATACADNGITFVGVREQPPRAIQTDAILSPSVAANTRRCYRRLLPPGQPGCWLLAAGCWPLAAGCWLLAAPSGSCSLVAGRWGR